MSVFFFDFFRVFGIIVEIVMGFLFIWGWSDRSMEIG